MYTKRYYFIGGASKEVVMRYWKTIRDLGQEAYDEIYQCNERGK